MNNSILQLLSTDFVIYALLAGLSLALVSGPLGSFIVWRRMSYFGDTLAHSSLLGIALGIITDINPQLSVILSCLAFAAILTLLDRKPSIATDTLLGILAHSTLALGIILLALTGSVRLNLEAYLFGALLTVDRTDLFWILAVTGFACAVLYGVWNQMLSATVHTELATIEGVNVERLNLLLVLVIALTIAVSMKIVGVLLITSLLIIPPAAARRFAHTPEQMAILASVIGALSVLAGLLGAFALDTPPGPSIVVVATTLFLVSFFLPERHRS
jgi:zinc transport system permease protein